MGLQRIGARLWIPYALLVLAGLIAFSSRDPVAETPRLSPPGPDDHVPSLVTESPRALLSSGTVARVSSYDWHRNHHPLFAIDGDPRPGGWQMWATHRDDREGWIELDFAEPRDVERVALDFVGQGDWPENALPDYRIECLRQGAVVTAVDVTGNAEMKPSHELICESADGLRVDVLLRPLGEPFSIVRLYEIDVVGPDVGRRGEGAP